MYLRSNQLKIWRVVDPNSTDALHPGIVTAFNLRSKLSNQLKIDLDEQEAVHICSDAPLVLSESNENKIQSMVDEFQPEGKCETKIKRLGEYVAKISLAGGYSVPLKFAVVQRIP